MNKKKQTLKEIFDNAFIDYKKRDYKSAENSCYKILSIDPNHFDSLFLLATISAAHSDFNKAKEFLLKSLEIQPKNTSALNNLATTYKGLGMLKEAANFYKKALEINPNHTNANYNLGLLLYKLGDLKKAKSYFKKTVEIQNNYALAFIGLANVHVDLKELKEALSCYQKAIEINPKIVTAHNNLGLLYRDLQDSENSIKCYQKAIELEPSYANSHHNLGQIYKEMGQFEKSIKSHKAAIKYEPNDLINYYFLSELEKNTVDKNLKGKIEKILLGDKTTVKNLAYGNYLLAKYERKRKNYEKELNYLVKGHNNFYKTKQKKFDENNKYCFDGVHQVMKGAKLEPSNKKDDIKAKPIFIIGVPRSGSTLVERIIGSGKEFIPVGEETGVIGRYVLDKVQVKQSLNLGDVNSVRNELFAIYKDRGLMLKKYNYTFTDKSLDNFLYLELIREIYPNAKIINCKRDVFSSIVSIFQNNLTELSWTHNLENIFRYFDNYFKIIENYNAVNSNFIYELQLEKLINNPAEEAKKLMKFCELPWDKKCLEFYKRKDLISKTASNIQVRQAIFKHPSNKYLPYKKYIDKYGKKYSWFN